jgi:hypothetical protein
MRASDDDDFRLGGAAYDAVRSPAHFREFGGQHLVGLVRVHKLDVTAQDFIDPRADLISPSGPDHRFARPISWAGPLLDSVSQRGPLVWAIV